jgi:hypothetical protein
MQEREENPRGRKIELFIAGISEHDMPLAELVRHHDDRWPIGLVTFPNCRVDMPRVGLNDTESDRKLREATYAVRSAIPRRGVG